MDLRHAEEASVVAAKLRLLWTCEHLIVTAQQLLMICLSDPPSGANICMQRWRVIAAARVLPKAHTTNMVRSETSYSLLLLDASSITIHLRIQLLLSTHDRKPEPSQHCFGGHKHAHALLVRLVPRILLRGEVLAEECARIEQRADGNGGQHRVAEEEAKGAEWRVESGAQCVKVEELGRSEDWEESLGNLCRHNFSVAFQGLVETRRTQNACSHAKFGWRLHAHNPRVMNPRLRSASVNARRAPGQAYDASTLAAFVRFHVWYAYC